ncbi:ciliary neurotrophic factor [Ictalurus punctatus]|uniref:Ciliary neurotrophic factor n=1 Tax=Ictalurus punctatus TaxID=7998 RepID=A0A979EQ99_ICTPU|nr:ciliary neurotrophic factor [Ictalurus punctatus]XP_047009367.1 ciliary neurotrophic factor [Ictalurus punctatus]
MDLKEKTVALARLLHKDCTQLLELYTNRESLPSNSVSGSQLVSIPPLTSQLSPPEKICFLHAALRVCLRLLDKAITHEDALFPNTPEDEYTKQRKTVRDRLDYLVMSTERLLVGGKRCDAEAKDLVDGGTFVLKKWILQVLQDIAYWSNKTAETLQTLPALTDKKPPRTRRATRKKEARKLRK